MTTKTESPIKPMRQIRSFVLRSRPWNKAQQESLQKPRSRYLYQIQSEATPQLRSNIKPQLTSERKIHLSELYRTPQPQIIEIGFGMGQSLLSELQSNPDYNYLGIEVHPPGVARLIKAADELNINNLRVIMQDACLSLSQLADKQADKIQIFFPDPWPKKRHHKRRLINSNFIDLILRKLKNQGCLHIATDHIGYSQHIKHVLTQYPNIIDIGSLKKDDPRLKRPIITSSKLRPQTKYERRGLNLGHPITDFIMIAT